MSDTDKTAASLPLTSSEIQAGAHAAGPMPIVTIALRRTAFLSTSMRWLLAMGAAFVLMTLIDLAPRLKGHKTLGVDGWLALWGLGAWMSCLVCLGLKRFITRMVPFLPIVFEDDGVVLPKGPEALRHKKLKYADIIAVAEVGRQPSRQLIIEGVKHTFWLPDSIFVAPQSLAFVLIELRRRLERSVGGTTLLRETDAKRRHTLIHMARRPIATQAILGLIAVFLLNTWLKGALEAPFGLLRWGANAPALVRQGEVFRIFAANFLHAQLFHALVNGMALWYLGNVLERLLGWARFLNIYLLSGAVAMAASCYVAKNMMSVGASGAIFGLLGAFWWVSIRLRVQLPLGVRQTPRWWLTMLFINTLLPLLWPLVDVTAHVVGFLTGLALCGVMVRPHPGVPPTAGRAWQGAAALLSVIYALSLGLAVSHAARTSLSAEGQAAKALLIDPQTDAATLDTLARLWALDSRSTDKELSAAEQSAYQAVTKDKRNPAYLATLAAILSRRHDVTQARATWQRAFEAALIKTELATPTKNGEILGDLSPVEQDVLFASGQGEVMPASAYAQHFVQAMQAESDARIRGGHMAIEDETQALALNIGKTKAELVMPTGPQPRPQNLIFYAVIKSSEAPPSKPASEAKLLMRVMLPKDVALPAWMPHELMTTLVQHQAFNVGETRWAPAAHDVPQVLRWQAFVLQDTSSKEASTGDAPSP